MRFEQGSIAAPDSPALGVRLDRDKLNRYELYKRDYPYDQDPLGWAPITPNDRGADPADDRTPAIPY